MWEEDWHPCPQDTGRSGWGAVTKMWKACVQRQGAGAWGA